MRTHELKTWPGPFAALLDGSKTFELRRDDRAFVVGDTLVLKEFDPGKPCNLGSSCSCRYTGRYAVRVVTYRCAIVEWVPDAPMGWVVLGLGDHPQPLGTAPVTASLPAQGDK